MRSTDVVIIGGGLAGTAAALLLGRSGIRVLLLDRYAVAPRCFKAEKIEPDQAELLRKLDLLALLVPWAARIEQVEVAGSRRGSMSVLVEQYGIPYHDMVNALRRHVVPPVVFEGVPVQKLQTGPEEQLVTLVDGTVVRARLVALACGTAGRLHEGLGLTKRMIRQEHSLAFGFMVARADGRPFPFDALTYHADDLRSCIDFLTLFPMPAAMRANLFTYHPAKHPWVRDFIRDPGGALRRSLPRLGLLAGALNVVSKVETGVIDLYVTEGVRQPGLVVIGDAFQSVCPATGTGLSRVLTDVDVLCNECIPDWLATPGMGPEKIDRFYGHPRKLAADRRSLAAATRARECWTASSVQAEIRRRGIYATSSLSAWWHRLNRATHRSRSADAAHLERVHHESGSSSG